MKKKILNFLKCPKCDSEFMLDNIVEKNGEIYEGVITCKKCNLFFPIKNYIPRFIESKNYSKSWGELWKNTAKIVRDSCTGDTFYYDVIFGKYAEDNKGRKGFSMFGFEWQTRLFGQDIIEVGAGTGCCTEHLVKTGANILSVDMSDAIDTLSEELLTSSNLNVIQADINSGVIKNNMFDRIWLFQVLQHTPNPPATLKFLHTLLKRGGEISFTSYASSFYPWYWHLTKNMSYKSVYKMVKLFLPFKYYGQKFFDKAGLQFFKKLIVRLMEPVDPRNLYFNTLEGLAYDTPAGRLYDKTGNKNIVVNLAVLNTFDRITPIYTNGADHETVKKWSMEAGFKNIKIWGKSGVRVRANKS